MVKKDVIPYEVVIGRVLKAMQVARDQYLEEEISKSLTEYYISANDLEIEADGTIDSRLEIEVWYTMLCGDVGGYVSLRVNLTESDMAHEITNKLRDAYDNNLVLYVEEEDS